MIDQTSPTAIAGVPAGMTLMVCVQDSATVPLYVGNVAVVERWTCGVSVNAVPAAFVTKTSWPSATALNPDG